MWICKFVPSMSIWIWPISQKFSVETLTNDLDVFEWPKVKRAEIEIVSPDILRWSVNRMAIEIDILWIVYFFYIMWVNYQIDTLFFFNISMENERK